MQTSLCVPTERCATPGGIRKGGQQSHRGSCGTLLALEYATRHIDGAVNLSVADLKDHLAEVEKLTGGDKKKPIVVYCQAGGRAGRAKGILVDAGYEQVTNLGGIGDWDRQ